MSRTGDSAETRAGFALDNIAVPEIGFFDDVEAQPQWTADGFVQRVPHPDDRRSTLAAITEKGSRTAIAATEHLNQRVFSSLPLDEADQLEIYDTLTSIRQSFGDFI